MSGEMRTIFRTAAWFLRFSPEVRVQNTPLSCSSLVPGVTDDVPVEYRDVTVLRVTFYILQYYISVFKTMTLIKNY